MDDIPPRLEPVFALPPIEEASDAEPGAFPYARFGSHIRRLRLARGWTQEELAERAELAADTIRRVETGSFAPSITTLWKLASGLKLPLSIIFEGYELRARSCASELDVLLQSLDEQRRAPFFQLMSEICDVLSAKRVSSSGQHAASFDYDARTIGEHIKYLRNARGMTQEQLAERAELSTDTVRRAERGKHATSFKVIDASSRAMGISLSTFFAGFELRMNYRPCVLALDWIELLEPEVQGAVLRVIELLRLVITTRAEGVEDDDHRG